MADSTPGEYASVDGVYVGPDDSIYVADGDRYRLLVYDPSDLTYVRQIDYSYVGATRTAVGISPIAPVMLYAPMILPDNAEEARFRFAVQTSAKSREYPIWSCILVWLAGNR